MQVREFKVCDPGTSGYAARITKKEWEKYKPYLTKLHEKGLTRLDIVRASARDHGFRPSYGQLNGKFREWGLKVYTRGETADKTESTTPISELSTFTSHEGSADDFNFQSLQLDESPICYTHELAETSDVPASSWPDLSQPASYGVLEAISGNYIPDDASQDFVIINEERPKMARVESIDTSVSYHSSEATSASGLFFANFDGSYLDPQCEDASTLLDGQEFPSDTYTPNEPNLTSENDKFPDSVASEYLDVSSITSLWSQRVGCRVDEASLRATFYLAAAFHSTELFEAAFELWKNAFISLSRTSQHDDISRLGALVHCARSACNNEAVSFVQYHIADTVMWCNQNWDSEDMKYGQGLYSYLLSLQAGLSKTPAFTSTVSKHSDCMCALVGTRQSPKDFGYQLFSHIVASKDQPDPMYCMSLVEILCCLLTWCFHSFRPPRPRFEATFADQSWCNVDDKWMLIRQITVYLFSVTERKGLSEILEDRGFPCKCGRCESMVLLFDSSPMETFTAVAMMIVDRIESLFGPFISVCDTNHVHLGGTIPLDRAINSLLSSIASFDSFQDVYNSMSSLRDFMSLFQSRFEVHFVGRKNGQTSLTTKVALQMMDAICGQVQLNPRNRSYSDSGINLKIRSSTLPARQWFRKLSAPAPLPNNASQPNENTGLKRPRSAVSSMRTSNVSRSSSMRSFEHLAKRIKERSSLSAKSTRSKHSHLTRSSSQGSWSFTAVTGLDPDTDHLSKPLPHRIVEEESITDETNSIASGIIYPQHLESLKEIPGGSLQRGRFWSRRRAATVIPQNTSILDESIINRPRRLQKKSNFGSALEFESTTGSSVSSMVEPEPEPEPSTEEGGSEIKLHNEPVVRMAHF